MTTATKGVSGRRLRTRTRSPLLATVGGVFDWATVELLFRGLRERVGRT